MKKEKLRLIVFSGILILCIVSFFNYNIGTSEEEIINLLNNYELLGIEPLFISLLLLGYIILEMIIYIIIIQLASKILLDETDEEKEKKKLIKEIKLKYKLKRIEKRLKKLKNKYKKSK